MTANTFVPVPDFDFDINRAERTQQVRYLVPLLATPEGRTWFLRRIARPCSDDEAREGQLYHLAFPLRDLFTADFHTCRAKPVTERARWEDALITYYNTLFGLPLDYGTDTISRRSLAGQSVIQRRLDELAGTGASWRSSWDPTKSNA